MSRKYTITLNEEQLMLVSSCVEDIHRFLCGDYQEYDWAGNGCPDEAQRRMIAQTYYLYREMRHQYTLANNHNNVYTSPTLTCEDSGEPIRITWDE